MASTDQITATDGFYPAEEFVRKLMTETDKAGIPHVHITDMAADQAERYMALLKEMAKTEPYAVEELNFASLHYFGEH